MYYNITNYELIQTDSKIINIDFSQKTIDIIFQKINITETQHISYKSYYNIDVFNNSINESIYEVIKEQFLNEYDKINGGKDLEAVTKNIIITMTNTYNQKNNLNKNKTVINLGECENKLKIFYNISDNASLYILKIDKKEDGMKIPKIEYEIFYPLYDNNLIKLNLSICKDTRIDITIPICINDTIDKYNASSNYYNNICSTTTSNSGTDISLSDRKNNFKENNMTLCEEDCYLVKYNYTTEKADCSCLVKVNLPFIEDIKFDKDKLYKSFTDIKNIANIKFMKCYKNVFNKKGLVKNYGFFIYLFIFILFFICIFLFYYKYNNLLHKEIDKVTEKINQILKSNAGKKKSKNKEDENIETIHVKVEEIQEQDKKIIKKKYKKEEKKKKKGNFRNSKN